MQEADVILLLLSADFLALDHYHERARAALAERARGATVVPILLRPTLSTTSLPLQDVQRLPRNGIPITRWPDRDEAWKHICLELRIILERAVRQRPAPQGEKLRSFGQYEVIAQLGAGAFSRIYMAKHTMFDRVVAIKVTPASPQGDRMIVWEAKALHTARGPGVVELYDAGRLPDGTPYLVQELVPGAPTSRESLGMTNRNIVSPRLLEAMAKVAGTLKRLHACSVIHGDLKPFNMIIAETGTVKLIDFGAARVGGASAWDADAREGLTLFGTPAYIAPELVTLGPSSVSDKIDVFSLGATLFELCVGHLPFERSPMKVFRGRAPSVSSLNQAVPERLGYLVDAMLDESPAERPTMRDVEHFLLEVLRAEYPAW